jgi:hypothetical protein
MRLLFLYSDYGHAEPLLRVRDLLAGHGILIDSRQCTGPAAAARWARLPADAVLAHHTVMCEELLGQRTRPVALLERIDGAQLESRHWLPEVVLVLKSYAYRDRALHNAHKGRLTAHRIRAAGLGECQNTRALPGSPVPLTATELAKIHVVYGFGAHHRREQLVQQFVDFDAPRPYRLQFRGHLEYAGTEIELHRRAALTATEATANMWPGEVLCGRAVPYGHYCREMFLSRAVLSPWGWGEACHRDYEAMLLGAVLIKPDSDYVEAWPDLYRGGATYVPCAVDCQDVAPLTREITDRWPEFRGMRERAHAVALEAASDAAIAARLAQVLLPLQELR